MMLQTNNQIPKLAATNYASWAIDMKFLLLEKNCYDIVTGTEKEPTGDSAKTELKDFNIRKRLALSILYLNISPEYRKIVENLEEPKDVWETLNRNFRPDNRSYHMKLVTELFSCKIDPGEGINLFSSRVQGVAEQLKSMGKPVEEVYLSYQLLRYLPERYDPVVQNILRWKEEAFKYKNILLELISEETRLKVRNQDRGYAEKSRREIMNVENIPKKCSFCNKPNHSYENCWHRNSSRGKSQSFRGRKTRYRPPSSRGKPWSSPSRPTSSCVYDDVSSTSARWNRPRSRECYQREPQRCQSPGNQYQNPQPYRSARHSSRSPERSYGPTSRQSKDMVNTRGNSSYSFLAEANVNYHEHDDVWIFDTAASHHFCKDREMFVNFKPVKNEKMVLAADGVEFPIEGRGDIYINFGYSDCCLKDVLYSPRLRRNLISGTKLDIHGFCFSGENGRVTAWKGEAIMFKAKLEKGLYNIFPISKSTSNVEFKQSNNKLEQWHSKFGHANLDYIVRTSQLNAVKGMPTLKRLSRFSCESCRLNKHRKVTFQTLENIRSRRPLQLLYLDVWGPTSVVGRKGERFYLSIIDDYSRRVAIYPIFEKSDVFEVFERHVIRAERALNLPVKAIRTDNGREFDNRSFERFCNERGIKREFTNVYTPQQNGVAERVNRTVVDGARTILYESNISKSFWPEAVLFFVHVWNRLCHRDQSKTPIELYTGSKPSVRHLKRFGSMVYVGIPRPLRHKLDPKAQKGIIVGYALGTKGYRVYLPDHDKVIETCNVSFPKSEQRESGAVLAPENWNDGGSRMEEVYQEEEHDENQSSQERYGELGVYTPGTSQLPYRRSRSSSDSQSETDDEENGDGGAAVPRLPASDTTWTRKISKRPDGSRTDIYYYDENRAGRLRSLNNVKEHCQKYNLKYKPEMFDFKGKNLYEGPINPKPSTSGIQRRTTNS